MAAATKEEVATTLRTAAYLATVPDAAPVVPADREVAFLLAVLAILRGPLPAAVPGLRAAAPAAAPGFRTAPSAVLAVLQASFRPILSAIRAVVRVVRPSFSAIVPSFLQEVLRPLRLDLRLVFYLGS